MSKFERSLLMLLLTIFTWAVENFSKTSHIERVYKEAIGVSLKELF
jgi:hypothetical protein